MRKRNTGTHDELALICARAIFNPSDRDLIAKSKPSPIFVFLRSSRDHEGCGSAELRSAVNGSDGNAGLGQSVSDFRR